MSKGKIKLHISNIIGENIQQSFIYCSFYFRRNRLVFACTTYLIDGLKGQEKNFSEAFVKELAKGKSEDKAVSIAKTFAKSSFVKRMTRKVNIFSKSLIFIPTNIDNCHWTLIVVYIEEKKIVYYDSLYDETDSIYAKEESVLVSFRE